MVIEILIEAKNHATIVESEGAKKWLLRNVIASSETMPRQRVIVACDWRRFNSQGTESNEPHSQGAGRTICFSDAASKFDKAVVNMRLGNTSRNL